MNKSKEVYTVATKIKVRKPLERVGRVQIETGPGKTEQAHKTECDMNFILKDYARTGFIRHAKENQGRYDDIAVQDFQQAMFIVAQANSMFEELPSKVRKEFHNDPSQFLSFVQNPENESKMRKLGILKGNDGIDMQGARTNAPIEKPPVTQSDVNVNKDTSQNMENVSSQAPDAEKA
jgi:phage internal scaffolding protein